MIYLASKSPRREELLKKLISDFVCVSYDIDENPDLSQEEYNKYLLCSPEKIVSAISRKKALESAEKMNLKKDDLLIASDTAVFLNGRIFGKPLNKEDAVEMLMTLSKKEHIVCTAVTLYKDGKIFELSEKTYVTFNELSDSAILKYLDKYKPYDKAGSYGIQDDFPLVKKIEGDFDNVMGLPTKKLKILLDKILEKK